MDRGNHIRWIALDDQHRTSGSPANTKHLYNIYTMLAQRRRRWANIV